MISQEAHTHTHFPCRLVSNSCVHFTQTDTSRWHAFSATWMFGLLHVFSANALLDGRQHTAASQNPTFQNPFLCRIKHAHTGQKHRIPQSAIGVAS